MKKTWPERIILISSGIGSFTFTISSARSKISFGVATSFAPDLFVDLVGEAGADAGVVLDEDLVAGFDEEFDADGHHRDAVFIRFHFFRYADDHFDSPRNNPRMAIRGLLLWSDK